MESPPKFDGATEIVGSQEFIDHVTKALTLLKEKSHAGYPIVKEHIRRIQEVDKNSGMVAYENPPTFNLSPTESLLNESNQLYPPDYKVQWCASAIAHDAHHSKMYHDYQDVHGLPRDSKQYAPDSVWTGVKAELDCITFQKSVCREIGANDQILQYLENCNGQYCLNRERP